MSIGELRYFLAQFMFVDDDIDKPIAGLSGGVCAWQGQQKCRAQTAAGD